MEDFNFIDSPGEKKKEKKRKEQRKKKDEKCMKKEKKIKKNCVYVCDVTDIFKLFKTHDVKQVGAIFTMACFFYVDRYCRKKKLPLGALFF